MANQVFTEEYDRLRTILTDGSFASGSHRDIADFRLLLREDGPDRAKGAVLDELRRKIADSGKSEYQYIFEQLNARDHFGQRLTKSVEALFDDGAGAGREGRRAAVFKGLRHFYLLKTAGGHDFWLMSLPAAYRKWPSEELDTLFRWRLKGKLNDVFEHFTRTEKNNLKHATQEALKWVQKAQAMCTGTVGVGGQSVDDLVRRWFADEDTDQDDIKAFKRQLARGFSKIAVAVNAGKLILTDNPIDRGKKEERYTEAYVWYDRLNVVYVEAAFFDAGGTLEGLTNWTRIMVHELSHKVCNTKDWDDRYAWKGIQPNRRTFPANKAIQCADSWAYFAADCNGSLTEKNRLDALQIA